MFKNDEDALYFRKLIVAMGLFPFALKFSGWFGGHFFRTDFFMWIFIYAITVTIIDVIATHGLKIRTSLMSTPEKLLLVHQITPVEMDIFYKTRTQKRILSTSISFLFMIIAHFEGLPIYKTFAVWYCLSSLVISLYYSGVKHIYGPNIWYGPEMEQHRTLSYFFRGIGSMDVCHKSTSFSANHENHLANGLYPTSDPLNYNFRPEYSHLISNIYHTPTIDHHSATSTFSNSDTFSSHSSSSSDPFSSSTMKFD